VRPVVRAVDDEGIVVTEQLDLGDEYALHGPVPGAEPMVNPSLTRTPADGSGLASLTWWGQEATRLVVAERERESIELLSCRGPGVTLAEAYRVQRRGVALRLQIGARLMGHKVGLTSVAMQRQFGIDEPDSGVLLDDMEIADGGLLRWDELIAPRVEAEIAFRLGADLDAADLPDTDLPGSDRRLDQVRAAVAEVFLAAEVIDSRYRLPGITVVDSVADNAACARVVLGQPVALPGWDLRDEELTLSSASEVRGCGAGRAVLGDPLRSVVWLADRLAEVGGRLVAGEVILAGAVHASVVMRQGETVTVSSPRLPGVRLDVA